MQVQVNTDKNIVGSDALTESVKDTLSRVLARFAAQITRLEVHLSDENGAAKSGAADMRCLLEVRLAGREPSAVSDAAETIEQAVAGAAQKMSSLLERELGKLGKR